MGTVKEIVQRSGLGIVLEDEIRVLVRLTDRDPPTAVRVHLSFLPEENGVHKISAGGHEHVLLGMYWFKQCLDSRDCDALQRLFFPMWLALEQEFKNQHLQSFWKRLRRDDLRAWCSVMESYFAGLDGAASLADPPIARLFNKEPSLLMITFSRVMGWLEHRFALLERSEASPKEISDLCGIWEGRPDAPAAKCFLSPYYANTPVRVFLGLDNLETFRARSGRICERMILLVQNTRPDLAKAIREAVEAEASSSAR